MYARTYTSTLEGLDGTLIEVEVDLSKGLPYTHLVGSTDNVIKESIERIRAVFNNYGYSFPSCRITINLAPAYIKKRGSHYDLPIGVAIVFAGRLSEIAIDMKNYAFFGEMALDGKINPVRGLLPLAMCAEEAGIKNIVVPYDNRYEVSLLEKSNIILVKNFNDVIEILKGNMEGCPFNVNGYYQNTKKTVKEKQDFSQVYGQENVKRALLISAAGGHSMFMMGPPGTGKTMLAQRFNDILPPLSYEEQVEITKIHSIGGLMENGKPLMTKRPFRAPHNSITLAGFFGGGKEPKPGELSYAHKGVLFLDELQFFDKKIIDFLRIPLEEKQITLTRNRQSYIFPADVILLVAANPCRCGYRGDDIHLCTCTQSQIRRYLDKLSGPLVDRIDMHVRMNSVEYDTIDKKECSLTTKEMRKIVFAARKIQEERYKCENYSLNSHLDIEGIKKYINLDKESKSFIKSIYEKLGLSVRSYNRILKISRTIADINNEENINTYHIAEAVQYRNISELYRENKFDRNFKIVEEDYDSEKNKETCQEGRLNFHGI